MGVLVAAPDVQISRAVRDPDFKLFQVEPDFQVTDPNLFQIDIEEIPADFQGIFANNFGWSGGLTGEPIPEPTTAALIALGLLALGRRRRKA